MDCKCREVRRYQHGKQTGGYIEKCDRCREKEAAAQELIKWIKRAPIGFVEIAEALERCKAAGWETEG